MARKYLYDEPLQVEGRPRQFLIGSVICMLLLFISIWQYQGAETGVHESHLVYEKCVINAPPKRIEKKGKSGSTHIEFTVMEHKRQFRIEYPEYACLDWKSMIENVRFSDTIIIGMTIDDYAEVDEETWSANFNEVVTFECKGVKYVTRECRNRVAKSNVMFGFVGSIVGIVLFGAAFFTKRDPQVFGLKIPLMPIVLVLIFVMTKLIMNYLNY